MSEIKVNKLSSRTGNAVTLGTSGDTFTIPAGVTLTNSGTATVTANMAGSVTSVAFAENEAGFMIWSGADWHLASKTVAT